MPLSQRHDANAARRTLPVAATDEGDVALRDGFDHVPGCACATTDSPPERTRSLSRNLLLRHQRLRHQWLTAGPSSGFALVRDDMVLSSGTMVFSDGYLQQVPTAHTSSLREAAHAFALRR